MNYLVVNSMNGNIVLMGSEDFCNQYKYEFPEPEFKMIEEEMYDDFIGTLQDAYERLCETV